MPQYGDATYWEERYAKEPGTFDWYQGYAGLKKILDQYIPARSSRVLQVGVGTSRLQEEMVRVGGYQDVVNVDYSTVVISHMAQQHADLPQLKYQVADCRHMPEFTDGEFDVVLDKGTMDAILCGDTPAENCIQMICECSRVLKPGGYMIVVTYGKPFSRLIYFDEAGLPEWADIEVFCITKQDNRESHPGHPSNLVTQSPGTVRGPFHYTHLEAMEILSKLEDVHYVYVLHKAPVQEGSSPHSGSDVSTADIVHPTSSDS